MHKQKSRSRLFQWTSKKETRTEQTSTAQTLSQPPNKLQSIASRSASKPKAEPETTGQPVIFRGDTAFTRLADGFDFPIGKPDAQGYYKARGFRSRGHLGEDWDGIRGGDTDLGDPIYSIGDGVVVFARDCHMGWGNVIIVRHSYREGGTIKNIDALYGHLNSMLAHRGQAVSRGQKIATMGNAHGLYDAHLHLGDPQEPRDRNEPRRVRPRFQQLLRSKPIHPLASTSPNERSDIPHRDEYVRARRQDQFR